MIKLTTSPKNILILEDDADTRANLEDILSLEGYKIETASSIRAFSRTSAPAGTSSASR